LAEGAKATVREKYIMTRGALHAGAVAVVLAVGVSSGCGDDSVEGAAAKGELPAPVVTAYNSATHDRSAANADLRAPDNVTDTRSGAGFVLKYDKDQPCD
jgi:hypothetical protein